MISATQNALEGIGFHPLIARWFAEKYAGPTDIQSRAWPVIASGGHALITAPTGSGKTLTAFLWALNQLLTGVWQPGTVRVLYVSPLKALNNDIQRNLLAPLAELRGVFDAAGHLCPDPLVMTRSGDTDDSDRRRMTRRPPEILITTPESLNLILSGSRARNMLTGVRTVILDEVHAVSATKRGTHLMAGVERAARLSGEFQRVALSATVRPLDEVAAFVGGQERLSGTGPDAVYRPRPVQIVRSEQRKRYEVEVRVPPVDDPETPADRPGPAYPRLAREIRQILRRNTSTLLFTNNRRVCERLTLFINEDQEDLLAWSHHGSLSREVRMVVEERLKKGELKAIVATNSLELGIDVGALDEVVLVETPFSVSSAVQRVGRAGHSVGASSRATLYALHGRDLADAAVMARCVVEGAIEESRPVRAPLDVLAQVVAAMVSVEPWRLDTLYDFVRTIGPYRALTRRAFDLVTDMLAGRYGETRLRSLQPMISVDAIDGTATGSQGTLRRIYSSGGTIPDRGYFTLRRADTRARLGDLDEEFVWEQRKGTVFTFGVQAWRIRDITHNDVLVDPVSGERSDVPFWKGEEISRSFSYSERIGLFLEDMDRRLGDPDLPAWLGREHFMTRDAAESLVAFLHRQRIATGAPLPHRRHLLVERYADSRDTEAHRYVILHTLWGGAVNQPLAAAISQAWEERHGHRLESFANNDDVVLLVPEEFEEEDFVGLVDPGEIETLLRARLEQTGFFGARFRENAARALLLPKGGFGKRMPLWLNRQRSKKLFDAVASCDDFPILLETWRTCLHDEFDLPQLRALLGEVRDGRVAVSACRTIHPSPFADSAVWRMTNLYLYDDDAQKGGKSSNLSDDLLKEAVFSAELRPRIADSLAETFQRKARRLFPGYAPGSPAELLDWAKERLYLPAAEWEELLGAVSRDHGLPVRAALAGIEAKLVRLRHPDGREGVAALEQVPRLARVLGLPPDTAWTSPLTGAPVAPPTASSPEADAGHLAVWLGEWLRFCGPVRQEELFQQLPAAPRRIEEALEGLAEEQAVVVDHITESARPGEPAEVCDSENLEILLRLTRAKARPSFEALPIAALPLFLAWRQGLLDNPHRDDHVQRVLEPLLGWPMQPQLLETEILPARIPGYKPALLDLLAAETDLLWLGCGPRRIVIALRDQRDLLFLAPDTDDEKSRIWADIAPKLFADPNGQYYFGALLEHTGLSAAELAESLWEFVWEGRVANDSFASLRKGIENRFKAPADEPVPTYGRKPLRSWRPGRAHAGTWFQLQAPGGNGDLLDAEELNRERVRLLLDRHGILFRELLANELPALRWNTLFRTLRRMELAGELLTGQFFEGIPGLQFASPEAFRMLQDGLPEEAVFWVNAADPASVCGLAVPGAREGLPARVSANHLVYHGTRLVVVSKRSGADLTFMVEPDDPRLGEYLGFMGNLLSRAAQPRCPLYVETINGARALDSPYLTWLRDHFDLVADSKRVTVYRKTT